MSYYMDSNMRVHQTPARKQRPEWITLTQYTIIDLGDQCSFDGGETWGSVPDDWIGFTLSRLYRRWFKAPPRGTLLRARWTE